MEQDVKAVTD